jgi:methyl coenzyme M reductase beta subunit
MTRGNTGLYIEEKILKAVRLMVEDTAGDGTLVSVVLSSCERSRKERVVRVDAYMVTVTADLPCGEESEHEAYAFAAGVEATLANDPALGGAADRAALAGKKYLPARMPGVGEGWRVLLTLRVTVESMEGR